MIQGIYGKREGKCVTILFYVKEKKLLEMDIIYLVFSINIIEMTEGMLHRRRCKCLQVAAFLLFSGLKSSVLKYLAAHKIKIPSSTGNHRFKFYNLVQNTV